MDEVETRLEDAVRKHQEAKVAYDTGWRRSMAEEFGPGARITDDMERESARRYALEHLEEVEEIDRLYSEVHVAAAALQRRKVEAEEALAPQRLFARAGEQ